MKSSVEQLDPTRVKISVDVPYAELKPSIDEAYKTIGGQVTIPGFRQGKVPARIIDQRVGRPAVIQEAINNGLDGFYRESVEEHDLKPMGQPEVEISEVPGLDGTEDGDLTFTVDVDVRPEITLPAYDTINVEVDPIEVTEEDVDAELEQLRTRFGTLSSVDRPASKDDFVTLDLVATIDGEEIDTASDISYQVGAGTMLDGMDEALDGLSADETTTFETTFAGGEHAGETGTVSITLSAVKVRELPEADDDFAQLASEFDTIDELRADLREQAAKQKETDQGAQARDKVLESLIETLEVPVPEKVVTDEVERHLESESRLDDDEHRKEVTEETERNLRTQFILDAIAEAEEVEVTQPELIEYLISASQQYGMNPNEFAEMLDSSGQVNALVGEVTRRKALAAALAGAVVKDTEGNVVDMEEFTSPPEDEAAEGSDESAEGDDDSEDVIEPDAVTEGDKAN
ncbi:MULTISPECIES: trigger factor [Brevibacterium]|uniref:Trigger factor n=2 Tax=Brevibacterium TaxID=1696 RepID=A0A1H1L2E6_BRESA|nr:trigger factor [Brevibacterium sandarakinum]SDR68079.1 trigger factor [Brevibacterium sandarakinum]